MKKESSNRRFTKTAYFWAPIVALLSVLIIELFNHKTFTTGFATLFTFFAHHPLALLVNFFLLLITFAPAFFFKRRTFYCAVLTSFWLILGFINGFILLNRMTPFSTADMAVLNAGLDVLPSYLDTGYIILICVGGTMLIAGLVLLFIFGPKTQNRLGKRLLTGLIALAVSGVCFFGSWEWAFDTHQLSSVFPNLAIAYSDYGFPFCFLETWLEKGISKPKNYTEDNMKNLLTHIDESAEKSAKKKARTDVNVVILQMESFVDPNQFVHLNFSENPVPNWTALREKYSTGYLTVPVVGAGTSNTECEVLTGMSTRLFGPGEYPYKTCLLDKTVESVAYNLKEYGYATHAIHNHRGAFYNRNYVYKNLGFDDFTSLEYMVHTPKTPKNWCKDHILTDQITDALDATENQSDFVFTVSVQGHGRYPTDPVLEDPAITVTACEDEDARYAYEYYVNQIYEMDAFLGQLTEELEKRDEKTILVIYGDHLPAFEVSDDDMQSGDIYKTEYIIWDNFGLKKQDKNLRAYQLSAVALGRIGISNGTFNRFQQFCNDDGNYAVEMHMLQYDALYGKGYLYGDNGNPYKTTKMKMGVKPITVTGIYQAKDGYYILGTNFTPFCKATVGDKIFRTTFLSPYALRVKEKPNVKSIKEIKISIVDKYKEILSNVE